MASPIRSEFLLLLEREFGRLQRIGTGASLFTIRNKARVYTFDTPKYIMTVQHFLGYDKETSHCWKDFLLSSPFYGKVKENRYSYHSNGLLLSFGL
jgi:hypothetical protein